MKLNAISISIAIVLAIAGVASAAGQSQNMPQIKVSAAGISDCTPPNDASTCADFHRVIRANFSAREIGMLFGCKTCYPEYLTGGIERLQHRYQAKLQEYLAAQQAASAAKVAAK